MRRSPLLVVLGSLGLLVLIFALSLAGGYNNLVNLDEGINGAYSEIENRLQERNDKIGQLIGVVQGLHTYGLEVYEAITDAREAYANADTIEELIEADAATAISMNQFLVVVEQNPVITPAAAYIALKDEISSMESMLSIARRDYNESVEDYNATVRRFPTVLFASMFGFQTAAAYWRMNDGADEVPVIDIE